jgi:uncharacterized repeat protein (TIGR01451 family)
VDKTIAAPGEMLIYTLTYTNSGDANAMNVIISDPLPAKTTFVSASPECTHLAGIVTCSVGTVLALGGTGSVTITVMLDSVFPYGTTNVINSATVQSNEVLTPVPSNQVTTAVNAVPSLSLVKAVDKAVASPGELLTYTLTYTNSGNADATGVSIQDLLPARTTFVSVSVGGIYSAGGVTWNIGTVAALGGTGTVSFIVQLDSVFPNGTTHVFNSATIVSAEVSQTKSNEVDTVVSAAPQLGIVKALDPTSGQIQRLVTVTNTGNVTSTEDPTNLPASVTTANVVKGTDLTYTINYNNTGNADATGIVIADTIPAGSSFVSASPGGVFSAGVVTWTIGTLPSGGGGTVTLTIRVGQ